MKHNNREEELLKKLKRYQFSKTEITDKSIEDLQAVMGWQGTGTEMDPIIINNLSGLKPNIWIHQSSLHYIIQEVLVYKLRCTSTQNIVIENCKINELEVEGCYNMKIRNNSILWLKFLYSKECVLENNLFTSASLEKLENNYFDNLYPVLQKILLGIVIPLLAFVAYLIFMYLINVWYMGLFVLGLIAPLLFVIHKMKEGSERTKERLENRLLGNLLLSNNDRKEIFNEILENYAYLGGKWLRYYLPIFFSVSVGLVLALIILYFLYYF
jgi:hypothetical protein